MNSRLLLTLAAAAVLALPAGAQMRNPDRAMRSCQDNVRARAMDQFNTDDVQFQDVRTGRNWIGGNVLVGEGQNAELHHFSCSVNYNGWIRSARIEGAPVAYNRGYGYGQGYGEAGRDMTVSAMDSCRSIVSDKIGDQGYFDVRINNMNMDPDGDRITGFARANRSDHPESFSFSCMLDSNGVVRSTSLLKR